MTFTPETDGAIIVPAHSSNILTSRPNVPKVSVLHTPQEPADNYESTPVYFQTPNISASTHAYADSDGDLYEMVPIWQGAIANGVTRATKPYPADTDPSYSLNYQSRSIEIEGYAASVHLTCVRGGKQWNTVVRWVLTGHQLYGIPLDRAHVIGHYDVASDRSDPGALDINAIIEDAQALLYMQQGGDDMGLTREEVVRVFEDLTGGPDFYQRLAAYQDGIQGGFDFLYAEVAALRKANGIDDAEEAAMRKAIDELKARLANAKVVI